jgi:hypothetical protein
MIIKKYILGLSRTLESKNLALSYPCFAFSVLLSLIMSTLSLPTVPPSTTSISSISVLASTDDDSRVSSDRVQQENARDKGGEQEDDNDNDESEEDNDKTKLLEICCAWSDKVSDGILEYRISDEADEQSKQAVRNAIFDWDTLIENLAFVENHGGASEEGTIDVEIGFSDSDEDANNEEYDYGDPIAAGKTQFRFDSKGFIHNIDVVLSKGIFGERFQSSALEQIARHEIGHVLGLGHANFGGSLMSESTSGELGNISSCEINGVLAANHWKLVDGGGNPDYPEGQFVVC